MDIPKDCMDLFEVFFNATKDVDVYNIFGFCYGLTPPDSTKSEETNHMHLKMPGYEERGLV